MLKENDLLNLIDKPIEHLTTPEAIIFAALILAAAILINGLGKS